MVALNGHIALNMPNEEYQAVEAISKSRLQTAAITMEKYYDTFLAQDKEPQKEKEALTFGNALHCRILEPERFLTDYLIVPKIDKRTKQGKEDFAHFEAIAIEEKKEMILDQDAYTCERVADRLSKHSVVGPLLKASSLKESSLFWIDPETGIECKCRPDALILGHGLILDTKSARSIEDFQIERENWERKHLFSPPHYANGVENVTGVEIKAYIFIAFEKERPYDVQPYILPDLELQAGKEHVQQLMRKIADCKASGIWPGRSPDIKTIGVPRYALTKYYGLGKENNFQD